MFQLGRAIGTLVSIIAIAIMLLIRLSYFSEIKLNALLEAFVLVFTLGIIPPMITLVGFLLIGQKQEFLLKRKSNILLIAGMLTLINVNYVFITVGVPQIFIFIMLISSVALLMFIKRNAEPFKAYAILFNCLIAFLLLGLVALMTIDFVFMLFSIFSFCLYAVLLTVMSTINLEKNYFEDYIILGIGNMLVMGVFAAYSIGFVYLFLIFFLMTSVLMVKYSIARRLIT